jgi:signal transduction histidine kinase
VTTSQPSGRWHQARRLRFRVAAALAVTTVTIVGLLGIALYTFAERYLVDQREESLLRRSFVDARVLRDELEQGHEISEALRTLDLAGNSVVVVSIDGRSYGTAVTPGRSAVPAALRHIVAKGDVAHVSTVSGGSRRFAVGLPLQSVDAEYFEVFSMHELDSTLATLRNALIVGGALAGVFGALLGLWLSRLVLRPVTSFAGAAERVAAGDLATRLTPGDDPDLASLAVSFNHMVDAMQRRIDREARFVADASHELRSPLTTLSTASQVVVSRADELPPRTREAVLHLDAEVARLQRLVEDLLELGRADAGVAEVDTEPVDVRDAVRAFLDKSGSDAALEVGASTGNGTRPPAAPVVQIDRRRLERVLANLVENAELHGGGLVGIGIVGGEHWVRIAVDDAGPGFEAADHDEVFARFYRGAAAGRRASTSGSGLGLSLVAEHIALHGGRVWIEDRPGGGARVVVELPRAGTAPGARS